MRRWLMVLLVLVLGTGVVLATPMQKGKRYGQQNAMQNAVPTETPQSVLVPQQNMNMTQTQKRIHEQKRLMVNATENTTCTCNMTCNMNVSCNGSMNMNMKRMGHEHEVVHRIEHRLMPKNVTERMHRMHEHIERARMNLEKAREEYEKARMKYMELRHRGLNDPETFRYAKRFVCSGIDYVERWLETLMVRVQTMNMGEEQKLMITERIRNDLNALNESLMKVNESTTPDQLRNAVQELKDVWNRVRVDMRAIVGQMVVTKLMNVTEKAEEVAMRIEAQANETTVQQKIEDCLNKLEMAREKLEMANEKFEEMFNATNPTELYLEGKRLVIEAKDLIRSAFGDIKSAYLEVRIGRIFYGNETGFVHAVGEGNAKLDISGFAVVAVNGSVEVTPSTAVVRSVGLSGENGTFTGHGRVIVRGDNVSVIVNGSFRIFAIGKGTVDLNGSGHYRVRKSIGTQAETGTFGNVTLELGVTE